MVNTRARDNDTGPTLIENKVQGSIWKKVNSRHVTFKKIMIFLRLGVASLTIFSAAREPSPLEKNVGPS
jgi:hypothetical protein